MPGANRLTRDAREVTDAPMLAHAWTRVAATGAANCRFVAADAMTVDAVLPEPVDYVFLANTFHGVPDQLGLPRAVAASLKPRRRFRIVNWQRLRRAETVVLGRPRGPKTEMRMEARCGGNRQTGQSVAEPHCRATLLSLWRSPDHYGVVLERRSE
jgi:hypothetical protein